MVKILLIDGPISVGKSSLARRLFKDFQEHENVVVLEEPLNVITQSGKHNTLNFIESSPAVTQLFIVQRLAEYYRNILASIPKDSILILDRYLISCFVFTRNLYQNDMITVFERDFILEAIRKEFETLPYPDGILFIRRDLQTCLKNIEARGRPAERWLTETATGAAYLAGLLDSFKTAEDNWTGHMVVNKGSDDLLKDFHTLMTLMKNSK